MGKSPNFTLNKVQRNRKRRCSLSTSESHLLFFFFLTAVRLVGDRNANFQGRVEVRLEGSWGRVCGVKWDIQDANIVCRHLGYEGAAVDPKYLTFGSGKGQIWMDNVQCRGNESSLFECKHDRWGGFRCESPEEARTVCKPAGKNNIT